MTFREFIYRTIKANIQKYHLFLWSTVFSMSVFFVFANLWFTSGIQENTNGQMHLLIYIAAVITTIFSIFIINYVHWHMMKDRVKSFSVLLSYGMSHKALRLLIILETCLIYSVSLILAFITGSVFSKLFFLMSIKLLMIDNVTYQLTLKAFAATALVFAVIFACVLLFAIIRIARYDITTLAKLKCTPEIGNKSKPLTGFIGILLIIASLTSLYIHNSSCALHLSQWILSTALINLVGVFLAIKHFSSVFYFKRKANDKKYLAHLLEASEFAMGYRQNVKTLFVLTLLTLGIVLFISVTYTLNHEVYRMTEKENPHDLYFENFQAEEVFREADADSFFRQQGADHLTRLTLPFLYMEVSDIMVNNWRSSNWIPVVSESAYNRCFHADMDINSGDTILIIFESEIDHSFTYFKSADILLTNSINSHTLNNVKTLYDKILNRYLFTQGALLVVDDLDYTQFDSEATDMEKGSLHMYLFEDWKKSDTICQAFISEFYQRLDETAMQNKSIYEELLKRYGYAHLNVRSKIDYYKIIRLQGSFSLYIMSFVSILFAFCIMITYYFKVFMEVSKDNERFCKLDGIGFLKKEKEKLIKARIRLIMFVPTLFGILLGIGWCYALNYNKMFEVELSNFIILRNATLFSCLLCGVILLEYMGLSKSYMRRLGL